MKNCLKAGAGTATIHFPKEIFPIEGFKGVHDAPNARVLVIECGERVAIAALELVNVSGDALDEVREIIAKTCGVKTGNVWVHITHAITTPHIPMDPTKIPEEMKSKLPPHMLDPDNGKKRELFLSAMLPAVSLAAERAMASFRPAKLGIGTGKSNVNVNRDVETRFGWWLGLNPNGKSNKTVTVLRFEDLEGQLIGLIVNYGLKPCAIDNSEMREGNRLISSDIPGYACNKVEKKYGVPCLYIMSAAGDQVPREMALLETVCEDGSVKPVDHSVAKGLEIVERLGEEFTSDLFDVIDGITCRVTEAEVRSAKTAIPCGFKKPVRMRPTREIEFVKEREGELETEIITLGDIAFVAAKPEINAQTEAELQEQSPFVATLLFSMTNGNMKYMPDKSAYERITWESQSAMLMGGTAEAWVAATVDALKNL